MVPGPIEIKKCTNCSGLVKGFTLISGNTFGATYWSDGKCETPMLPDYPRLVICPHCKDPTWVDALEVIGEIQWDRDGSEQREFEGAALPILLTLNDYLTLLEKEVNDSGKEYYIRQRAWWKGNDQRRNSPINITMSSEEEQNLKKFAELIDETETNGLIMRGEVMRELGRFDAAKALLERVKEEEIKEVVEFIKNMAAEGDRYVREIEYG